MDGPFTGPTAVSEAAGHAGTGGRLAVQREGHMREPEDESWAPGTGGKGFPEKVSSFYAEASRARDSDQGLCWGLSSGTCEARAAVKAASGQVQGR